MDLLPFRMDGAKDRDAIIRPELVLEDCLLCIRLTGQHQNRLDKQRSFNINRSATRRGTEPRLVFSKEGQNSDDLLGLVVLEIEIERDQRPISSISFAPGVFNNGTDARKKYRSREGTLHDRRVCRERCDARDSTLTRTPTGWTGHGMASQVQDLRIAMSAARFLRVLHAFEKKNTAQANRTCMR